ncbi:MAG: ATP-binding protein [Sodalis sp. (in: enterobacteria)]|uniref:ATP-binding protein n=1 Tax=Sodalis sp. (in: enterobacteria) TaxID=1898979 RepID=UPI0039E5148C
MKSESVIGRDRNQHPNTDMVQQLKSHQTLGQEVIANLPLGLLIYNFSDNTLVASNKIADHLLPHLSLQKIANLAEGHQGVIQATVNNEVYEIRMFKSQIAPQTWLFQLLDQDKEVLVNKKLQQAQRELDKNHEALRAILNNIQQELNTPLAAIGLLVDRITASQEEQQAALLAQLRQESSRLMGLTDNLQLLTRLELQEWQPASAPINLHQLCDDVLRDRLPLLSQKGPGLFHHYLLPFDRHYTGDAQAVSKVIVLILDYAITTTHFGKITLRVSGDDAGGAITFSLSDTGSGIGEQELANLSQPFVSAAQQDRYQRGSGLTWFLCDQLCRRMGGRLAIQSRVDIGTCYTLSLPLAPLEGDAGEEAEKLLEDTLVLLEIRNEKIRTIVSGIAGTMGRRMHLRR